MNQRSVRAARRRRGLSVCVAAAMQFGIHVGSAVATDFYWFNATSGTPGSSSMGMSFPGTSMTFGFPMFPGPPGSTFGLPPGGTFGIPPGGSGPPGTQSGEYQNANNWSTSTGSTYSNPFAQYPGSPGDNALFTVSPSFTVTSSEPLISIAGLTTNPFVNVTFQSFRIALSDAATLDGTINFQPDFFNFGNANSLTAAGALNIGATGPAQISTSFTDFSAGTFTLGAAPYPFYTASLLFDQGAFNITGAAYVGGGTLASGANSTLSFSGSEANIGGALTLYALGHVNLYGAVLTAATIDDTQGGSITINDATLKITNGGIGIGVGRALGTNLALSRSEYALPAGPAQTIILSSDTAGTFTIGTGATLTLNGGYLDVAGVVKQAGGSATYGPNGGTLSLRRTGLIIDATNGLFNQAAINIPEYSRIDVGGAISIGETAAATLSLAGSTSLLQTAGDLIIGNGAAGTFAMAGGQTTVAGTQVALGSTAAGYLGLSGGSFFSLGLPVFIGGNSVGAGSAGTLNLTGGTFQMSRADGTGSPLTVYALGRVNLSNATLTVPSLDVRSGGVFNFNSGTLSVTGTAGLELGDPASGLPANLTVSGSTSALRVTHSGTIGLGGPAALNFANGAIGVFGDDLRVGPSGGLTVNSNLSVGSQLFLDAGGTFSVGSSAQFTIGRGALLNGAATLGNSTRVSTGTTALNGQLTLGTGAVYAASGTFSPAATASITLNGGTLAVGTTSVSIDAMLARTTFNGGTLEYTAAGLDVGFGGRTIPAGVNLRVDREARIGVGSAATLTVAGPGTSFSGGSLTVGNGGAGVVTTTNPNENLPPARIDFDRVIVGNTSAGTIDLGPAGILSTGSLTIGGGAAGTVNVSAAYSQVRIRVSDTTSGHVVVGTTSPGKFTIGSYGELRFDYADGTTNPGGIDIGPFGRMTVDPDINFGSGTPPISIAAGGVFSGSAGGNTFTQFPLTHYGPVANDGIFEVESGYVQLQNATGNGIFRNADFGGTQLGFVHADLGPTANIAAEADVLFGQQFVNFTFQQVQTHTIRGVNSTTGTLTILPKQTVKFINATSQNLFPTVPSFLNIGTLDVTGLTNGYRVSANQVFTNNGVIVGNVIYDHATLAGSGHFYGGATFIGGLHKPGQSPGLDEFEGSVTYDSASTLTIELGGAATEANAGSTYDRVRIIGTTDGFEARTFHAGGAMLSLVALNNGVLNSTYRIVQATNTATVDSSKFANFASNLSSQVIGQYQYTVSYGTNYIDVFVTNAVPEPATMSLPLAAGLLLRRRRYQNDQSRVAST